MLVKVVETEVFVDVLLAVVWRCQACDRSEFIWTAEGALTFFEVFKTYSFNIERVPLHLTATIMGMPMEGRNNATEMKRHSFRPKWAFPEGRDKGAPNVVTETYVRSKILY